MGVYLKKFLTISAYNNANLVLPNVSLIEETHGVAYHPYDQYMGHAYVEIAGLKWATMNIGASTVTDDGLYFLWGDTQGYTVAQMGSEEGLKYFGWSDYKYNPSGDGETMTKYNDTDNKTVLDISDDAARANWGGNWRVPTVTEFQALGNAVNTVWTDDYQDSGVPGLVCTDKTDNTKVLFFPASGRCAEGELNKLSKLGYYQSCNLYVVPQDVERLHMLMFNSVSAPVWNANFYRHYGISIRAVSD